MANPQLQVRAVGSGGQLDVNVLSPDDNVGYAFGTDSEGLAASSRRRLLIRS